MELVKVSFNPPPAWSARGTYLKPELLGLAACFNPPPAWSARGTMHYDPAPMSTNVSIHPPLGRRGERATGTRSGTNQVFQSTPRLVGEGNAVSPGGDSGRQSFNPPPAWSARGTQMAGPCDASLMFQSTPRLVGEGNW